MTDKTKKALEDVQASIEMIRRGGFNKGKVILYIEEGEPTGVSIDGLYKKTNTQEVVRNSADRR